MHLFFDLETTGLPKSWNASLTDIDNWPRVVQVAWAVYSPEGKRKSKKNFIVYPEGFEISDESASIHRITTEKAKQEGVALTKVLREFNKGLVKASTVISHNTDFDVSSLNAEFARSNIKTNLLEKNRFCTMKTEEIITFCNIPNPRYGGCKWPSLAELHTTLFDTMFEDSHNAGADMEACARCYFELRKRGVIR
ncbi:MAG: 3'-5' exonuclease [Methanoregula sp.]|nr:3'-5' exonuclease [Methanoregula sp.]